MSGTVKMKCQGFVCLNYKACVLLCTFQWVTGLDQPPGFDLASCQDSTFHMIVLVDSYPWASDPASCLTQAL